MLGTQLAVVTSHLNGILTFFGIFCFSGPVASLCNERFSTRVTMFIGGVVSALGLFLTVFATEFYMVLLSFGCLTGKPGISM